MPQENANNQRLTFSKRERICSRLQIENLLRKKQSLFCYPFKCLYYFTPKTNERTENQILVSVPKRNFKHAVERNRIKRLTREAYRLQHCRHLDVKTNEKNLCADIFLFYVGKEILPYNLIEDKIIEVLSRLCKQLL